MTPVLKRAAKAEHFAAVSQKMREEDLIDQQVQLFTTPAGFCEGMLGLQPYEWQREVLSWFTDIWGRQKGVCAAPNGAGISQHHRPIGALLAVAVCGHDCHTFQIPSDRSSDLAGGVKHRTVPDFRHDGSVAARRVERWWPSRPASRARRA